MSRRKSRCLEKGRPPNLALVMSHDNSLRGKREGARDSWKRNAVVSEAFLENYVSTLLQVRSWAYGHTANARFPAREFVIVSRFRVEAFDWSTPTYQLPQVH